MSTGFVRLLDDDTAVVVHAQVAYPAQPSTGRDEQVVRGFLGKGGEAVHLTGDERPNPRSRGQRVHPPDDRLTNGGRAFRIVLVVEDLPKALDGIDKIE